MAPVAMKSRMLKTPMTPKVRRSPTSEVDVAIVVGGARMAGVPIANAEHNGTKANPIIVASSVRCFGTPGAAQRRAGRHASSGCVRRAGREASAG